MSEQTRQFTDQEKEEIKYSVSVHYWLNQKKAESPGFQPTTEEWIDIVQAGLIALKFGPDYIETLVEGVDSIG